MHVTMKARILHPRLEPIAERTYKMFETAFKQEAGEALTIASRAIHVNTGMSLGSIFPLARLLKVLGQVRRPPKVFSERGYVHMDTGEYDKDFLKTQAAGIILGEDTPSFTFKMGTKKAPRLEISLKIVVSHFALNDPEWGFIRNFRQLAGYAIRSSSLKDRIRRNTVRIFKREIAASAKAKHTL